jgi:hypothetical protein
MEGTLTTIVHIDANYNPWPFPYTLPHGYLEIKVENGFHLELIEADFHIFDFDQGTTHNFTIPASMVNETTVGTFQRYFWDFSAPVLVSNGWMPASFTDFEDLDSVIVKARWKVVDNIGTTMFLPCQVNTHIYLGVIDNQYLTDPVPDCNITACDDSVMYYCTKNGDNFELCGYSTGNWNHLPANACEQWVRISHILRIGIPNPTSFAGANAFPYEFRPWSIPLFEQITMPPGYVYNTSNFCVVTWPYMNSLIRSAL